MVFPTLKHYTLHVLTFDISHNYDTFFLQPIFSSYKNRITLPPDNKISMHITKNNHTPIILCKIN